MARAVIFDMDGTLVDTEPVHFDVARRVLAADGFDYTEEMNREFIGSTTAGVMELLVARHRLPRSAAAYITDYERLVVLVLAEPREPAPGARELIRALKARGARIGLASNSHAPAIAATLAGAGLAGEFETTVGGDAVPRSKPAPDVYLEAARRLGIEPAECAAIEDSPAGVAAARAAGMRVFALVTPHVDPARLTDAHGLLGGLGEFPLDLILPHPVK